MKVLVVGGGGREHALVWKLKQSPLRPEIFCAPGNAGTRAIATNVDISTTNVGALAVWAVENGIDFTVVGPEAPLADGIVDIFTEHGLRIFGPTKAAARLESSKAFAKEILLEAGVTTAKGAVFDSFEEAERYVREQGAPIVVKADGLAAGKGVVVAQTVDEAVGALKSFMLEGALGQSGKKIVVEDCLVGEEASVIALVDGSTVLPLVVSQDYKRVGDGNTGPNTGGMGAISPTGVYSDAAVGKLVSVLFLPVLEKLAARGIRYCGFLYAGVLVTKDGTLNVLEFNCRLGDPETQVLLMRLSSDLLPVLEAAADEKLSSMELHWKKEEAACVVMCSRGYPGAVDDGKVIEGIPDGTDDCQVFHSGTFVNEEGKVVSRGGRILTVSALGPTRNRALSRAYEAVRKIKFDGAQFRNDIGGGVW